MGPGAVISLSIIIFQMCVGIFANLFILFTILKDRFQGQTTSTGDKIIFSLICSNICLLIMTFISTSAPYFSFSPDIYTVYTINALIFYGRSSCAWLTTCLCFFYFIKITQLKFPFSSLLKKKIDVLIPCMILVIEALCLGSCFLSEMAFVSPRKSSNVSVTILQNTLTDSAPPGRVVLYISTFVSLLISVVLTALTAVSLAVHIYRMGRSSTDVKVQRVVKTMVHLMLFYLFFYSLVITAYCLNDSSSFYIDFFHVAQFIFSPVQAILLILGNPRYKEDITHMLCICLRVCILRS